MMQDWMTWVFDGIGSTIFSLIAGALIGGAAGYQIGIRKNVKQMLKDVILQSQI